MDNYHFTKHGKKIFEAMEVVIPDLIRKVDKLEKEVAKLKRRKKWNALWF